ncbi:chitin deacetylase 1 [Mycotypha africana]|uniref:chitin deacetylase 1 n=1 Tax=Mycotypha africana TaxID=64632 RepID=UPI0023016F2E|nr:chitin deacetylase 1 [Mycotypha africana]KAI8982287.1 chitin deacetylase 1 [Mycotypha africana]
MYYKVSAVAIALLQITQLAQATTTTTNSTSTGTSSNATTTAKTLSKPQDYWKTFDSKVDPLNIVIPDIPQTTSYDVNTECTYYQPPSNFVYNEKEWPTMWEIATSNGMNTSAEFLALYNSIDWKSAPNIPVRKMNADGSVNMEGYDQNGDPDCWWSASTCTKPKLPDVNEDIYACPEPETWGLTFDDGPNCSHNAFYDYLEQQKLKATMFYIGSNVINWPYGAQRGQKAGHHLADHTWSHQLMTTLTNQEVLAELYYTQKAIKMVTGVTPIHWRPAFGDVDDRVRWIATQLNLTTVLWNLDTDDWAAGSTKTVDAVKATYNDFVQMGSNGTFANSGQIVLTHEIDNTTMDLAMEYIPKIQAAYKNILDVATCMNITHPYQETTISFPSFSANSAVAATDSSATNSSATNSSTTSPSSSGKSDSKASSGSSTAVATAAGTSAGIQLTPNTILMTVFAIAAYIF